jgi:hypothetical protein
MYGETKSPYVSQFPPHLLFNEHDSILGSISEILPFFSPLRRRSKSDSLHGHSGPCVFYLFSFCDDCVRTDVRGLTSGDCRQDSILLPQPRSANAHIHIGSVAYTLNDNNGVMPPNSRLLEGWIQRPDAFVVSSP